MMHKRTNMFASLLLLSFLILLIITAPHSVAAQDSATTFLPIIGNGHAAKSSAAAAQVVAGASHYCALTVTGEVRCWGNNALGQLGNGTRITSNLPLRNTLLTASDGAIRALASGGNFACALLVSGRVVCWGYNNHGALGGGSDIETDSLVDVATWGTATRALDAGDSHACAIANAGDIFCWGKNGYGQVGDGTYHDRFSPVPVINLGSRAIQVVGGDNHTCALLEDARVKCWGDNGTGQLGVEGAIRSSIPVAVLGLSATIRQIDAAGNETCALTDVGAVYCWGSNQYLQLGVSGIVSSTHPIPVPTLEEGVRQVAIGRGQSCALQEEVGVTCWGYRDWQFETVDEMIANAHPQRLFGSELGVMQIMAGGTGVCVIVEGGGVKCWGWNHSGQLGNGTWVTSSTPVSVTGLEGSEP